MAQHPDLLIGVVPDYVNYICSQFMYTHINFQRVPMVDTSNPFIARDIPSPDESMVAIHCAKPKGIDFQYPRSMIGGAAKAPALFNPARV